MSFSHTYGSFWKHVFSTGQKQIHLTKSRKLWIITFPIITRGELRPQPNVYIWPFFSKIVNGFKTFFYFLFFSKRMGSKYASDSPHPSWLFLRENNTNLPILLWVQIILFLRENMKNKINLLLPFSVNSRSFAPAFHPLPTAYFLLYPFICLSYSTGYCFIFSHKRPAEATFK